MKSYHDTYAPEDRELFEKALIAPINKKREYKKSLKNLDDDLKRFGRWLEIKGLLGA